MPYPSDAIDALDAATIALGLRMSEAEQALVVRHIPPIRWYNGVLQWLDEKGEWYNVPTVGTRSAALSAPVKESK